MKFMLISSLLLLLPDLPCLPDLLVLGRQGLGGVGWSGGPTDWGDGVGLGVDLRVGSGVGNGVGLGVGSGGGGSVGNGVLGAGEKGVGVVGTGGRVTSGTGARVLSVPASTRTEVAIAARMAMQLVVFISSIVVWSYPSSLYYFLGCDAFRE